jgi:phosphomannomutase
MKKLMKEKKADFGGEISGHYYFALRSLGEGGLYMDSGILAAIQMINQVSSIKYRGEKLSDWIDGLPKYYRSGEINFPVEDKEAILKKIGLLYKNKKGAKISFLDGLKVDFSEWWFSVRPSNTEDLIRLNLEAKNKEIFEKELANLKKLLS